MANVNDNNINPKLVKIPKGYSNYPAVGKIQQLYALNNENLYKRLTPYTQNSSGLFSFGPRQPFVYVSPNKGRKGINGLKRFESRIFPIGSGLQDVQRIAKFLVTGKGILFLTKQFLLQRNQPFNETRIYNPLSVINAVVRPVTGFILPPPTRHLSGGLLGSLASLIGINVSSDKPIKGTVAEKRDDVLKKFEQTVHANRYGKGFTGLIRGGTAASAYYGKTPSGASGGLINFAKKLFGFGGTVGQPSGTQFRADEKYSIFDLKNGSQQEFGSYSKDGVLDELHQRWYNDRGPSGKPSDIIKDPDNEHGLKLPESMKFRKGEVDSAGRPAERARILQKHTDKLDGQEIGGKIKAKYGDTVLSNGTSPYASSEIILIYKNYISDKYASVLYNKIPRNLSEDGANYHSKGSKGFISQLDTDGTHKLLFFRTARLTKGTYEATIDRYDDGFDEIPLTKKIKYSQQPPAAEVSPLTRHRKELEEDSVTLAIYKKLQSILQENGQYGKNSKYGIYSTGEYVSDVNLNYLELMRRRKSPLDQKSLPEDGYQERLNKKGIGSLEDSPKRFSGTRRSDYVNTLQVLDESSIDGVAGDKVHYHPYRDDQIAFYFHDLVNDKYIPFRATLKGLNEQLTSNWSEVSYIGRADKLYNYTGFSRNISFNFSVVAMSIEELMPMWMRINYLASLTKPSKYTQYKVDSQISNFITPPLITFTIGDMYKEQPLILTTVGIQIPDEALWETLSEKYSNENNWSYLNDKIKWDNSGGKFAQFPRECDISITGPLLEQERPQTGKNNFGGINENGGGFSQNLIVGNNMGFDNRTESEQVKRIVQHDTQRIVRIGGRQFGRSYVE